MDNAKKHYTEKGNCLFCDWLDHEVVDGRRVIFRNEYFTVLMPFFSEHPYGVYVMFNPHKSNITEFTAEERSCLAETLRQTTGMFDSLFGYKFPYMMCMYNESINGEELSAEYHWHIVFYPPMCSAEKIKYNASSETGAWVHCNPTCPEDTSVELREAHARFMQVE